MAIRLVYFLNCFSGPPCAAAARIGGLLAAQWNFPLISYGGTSEELAKYETFTATVTQDSNIAKVFRALADKLNWRNIGLYKARASHWKVVLPGIERNFKASNITYTEPLLFNNLLMFTDIPAVYREHRVNLNTLRQSSRGKYPCNTF